MSARPGAEADWALVERLVHHGGSRYATTNRADVNAAYRQALARLEKSGASDRELAEWLKVDRRTVQRWRALDGRRRAPTPAPGEARAAIRALILAEPTLTALDAAKRLGCGLEAAAGHVKALQAAGELPARNNRANALAQRRRNWNGALERGNW